MLRGLMEVDHRQGFNGPVAQRRGRGAARRSRPGSRAPGRRARIAAGRATPSGSSRAWTTRPASRTSRWARTAASSPSPACAGRASRTPRSTTRTRSSRARLDRAQGGRRRAAAPRHARRSSRSARASSRSGKPKDVPEARRSSSRSSRTRRCRARSSPSTRGAGTSSRWWAATTSRPPSSTAPSRPAASPARAFKPIVYSAAIEKLDYTPGDHPHRRAARLPRRRERLEAAELRRGLQGRRDAAHRARELDEHPGGEDRRGAREQVRHAGRSPTGRRGSASRRR